MSKLSNCQIRATLKGMEAAAERDRGAHRDDACSRHRRARIDAYRAELAQREAEAADPGTSLQTVHHGESV
jgi:hypothetical protein